jgi:HEAT repeat protein
MKSVHGADVSRFLPQLFEAERNVRRLHAELAAVPTGALVEELTVAVGEALALDDEDEAALRLVRLASLLGEVEGPRAVDLLIDILGSEEPEARHASGEALEELAFDRFKEVALGTERALERLPPGNPALLELPYLLAGIGEPGVRKLLGRFLLGDDPEVVSAAIEAIVEMGDSGAAPLLERLVSDAREVSLEDDGGEEGTVTVGELASEAVKLLAEIEEPARPRGLAATDPSRAQTPAPSGAKRRRH